MAIGRAKAGVPENAFEANEAQKRLRRISEYDQLAPKRDQWRRKNAAYHAAIERLVRFVVPEGASVLEIGCSTGDLLAALRPNPGVGVDASVPTLEIARRKHPELEFIAADAETLQSTELEGRTFDYVVLSDVVGALTDVWAAFRALRRVCNARTRVIVTYYNFLWEPILQLGEKLGRKMPISEQNWLGMHDLENLLELNHLAIIRHGAA